MSDESVDRQVIPVSLVERLVLDPGDIVVLRALGEITHEQAAEIKRTFLHQTGIRNSVVVLSGIEVLVVEPPPEVDDD